MALPNSMRPAEALSFGYVKEWRQVVTRLGRWVDFDHDYKTMEPDYMESIWWVVKSLWDKGLIYEAIIFSHIVRAVLRYYPTMSFH